MTDTSGATRKKILTPRTRTGCNRCRAAHVRCDEGKPVCIRCAKQRQPCTYRDCFRDYTPQKKPPSLAPAIARSISPGGLYESLNPSSILYYDFFKTVVVCQLSGQPDGPSGFWSNTLLRECTLDSRVVDAVVAIGALCRARFDGVHPEPHHRLQQLGSLSCRHYYLALQYYTRSLADFRRRIEADTCCPIPPRTLLIFTMLFSIFEILHGNTNACDNLIANGLRMFSNQLYMLTMKKQQPHKTAPKPLDDEIHDAEFFLARTATWSAIFSPMYPRSRVTIASMTNLYRLGSFPPDRKAASVQDFWRMWWHFVTMAVIWHLRVRSITAQGPLEDSVYSELQQEQQMLLERTQLWANETQGRLDEVSNDQRAKHVLAMLVFEIRICYWSGYYALDPSETAWQSCKQDCIHILDRAQETVDELLLNDGYELIVSDGLLIGLLQLARECRDSTVRFRSLELSKRLITTNSTWHVKSFVMGTTACLAAEEMGRDPDTGHIPMPHRYDWTDGFWNDDFTELHTILTSKGKNQYGIIKQKHVVLCPKTLGVVYISDYC
ncbi:hypothetical protein B0I35DRAFT_62716 [Stachybotrys elegans]|uniref:Zn(2)-C6 fungal-type domain-containing protein n=1 Tax=Stachybotrys elegans TaxID=80388 RepID=A0A8K0WPI2_9HYPO|nr:hypothetical protein B0I35DRAFT_62716 [Stachybotrys elegans]